MLILCLYIIFKLQPLVPRKKEGAANFARAAQVI